MSSAPTPVIILLAGSPKEARRLRPGPYPAKPRKAGQWPLNQPVPTYTPPPDQIEAIKRRGRELLEAVRAQRRS